MKRPGFIIGSLAVCILAVVVYFATRTPLDVAPMGDESETIARISLAIAMISLLTAVVGLIQKVIELRATRGG